MNKIIRSIGAALAGGTLAAALAAVGGAGTAGAAVPIRGTFTPVDPVRVLDTRDGTGVADRRVGPLGAGQVIELHVSGVGGVPATGAGAVVLNVTATGSTDAGFVTVYPCGQPRPLASNLNFRRGADVANQVTAKIGDGGDVCLFTAVRTDLVADLSGWYTDDFAAVPGFFSEQLTPARVIDTRDGTGLGARPAGQLAAGEVLALTVAGTGGVPADADVRAVTMNVTATGATEGGFLTVFPCDRPRPWTSNVNVEAGSSTVANLATSRVSAAGQVCFYAAVPTDLVVDLQGYFSPTASASFNPMSPVRVLDTRDGTGVVDSRPARLRAGEVIEVQVAGLNGVPADARAVLLNVTITDAAGAGYVTAWPCGQPRPLASFLNHVRGVDRANLTPVRVGDGGKVCLFVHASTEAVADLNGYYSPVAV
ncbi:MAG: hypothetical protein AB7W59_15835 [Acidimicrobiia bacterium]